MAAPADPTPPEPELLARPARDVDDAPVPRLPRGRMFKLSMPALVRIAMTLTLLVMIIVIQKPCADGVSRFVAGFGSGSDVGSGVESGSRAGSVQPAIDPLEAYEPIHADMTPAEMEAAVVRARAKAARLDAGAGSAAPGAGAGSGAGI